MIRATVARASWRAETKLSREIRRHGETRAVTTGRCAGTDAADCSVSVLVGEEEVALQPDREAASAVMAGALDNGIQGVKLLAGFGDRR